MTFLLLAWLLQTNPVELDNQYVRVTKNAAPCASAGAGCGDRIVVALSDIVITFGRPRLLTRGETAVFTAGVPYDPPARGSYFEVSLKPNRPPVQSPKEIIRPEKNVIRYENDRFFVFEEKLEPGDTRPRHSHSQRVVIQLNPTKLQQWPDGESEIFVETKPDRATFNPPVIHVVKNVGDKPLRGIVIELKPEQKSSTSK